MRDDEYIVLSRDEPTTVDQRQQTAAEQSSSAEGYRDLLTAVAVTNLVKKLLAGL